MKSRCETTLREKSVNVEVEDMRWGKPDVDVMMMMMMMMKMMLISKMTLLMMMMTKMTLLIISKVNEEVEGML